MIIEVNWQTFQSVFMEQIIYVREDEYVWELWTSQGLFHVKCTVEKSEDTVRNMMFVDRNFSGKKNIIKIIDVVTEQKGDQSTEPVPIESEEAIREELEDVSEEQIVSGDIDEVAE